MLTLRPYQVECLDAIRRARMRGITRGLAVLPTGTGKTCAFASIAEGAEAKGNSNLILAHRDELITQAVDKLLTVAPELESKVGVVKAERDEWASPIVVASVQSLRTARRQRILDALGPMPFPVITVDEAHHTEADSYQAILQDFGAFNPLDGPDPVPLTVGWTATPQRSDKRDLGDTYQEIVYYRDILSMIREGYLCPVSGIEIRLHAFDAGALRTRAGDYVESQAGELLEAADAPRHAAAAWMANARGRKTLLFTPTVALADATAGEFRRWGVRAAMVSGKTPLGERRALLRAFRDDQLDVIANAMVLTEGFDEPSITCIMVCRPTKSDGLYTQMIGRGLRTYPGKEDCLVIDMVGASAEHSLQTSAKMFGLGEDDATASDQGDYDETAIRSISDAAAQAQREGRITATQIELFDRTNLNWQMASPGVWCLNLGVDTVICDVADGRWAVTAYPKDGGSNRLAEDLDLTYAMGVAEEYARRAPALGQMIAGKAMGWREKPPKQGQLDAMRKWRIPVTPGLTRGEASDLLGIKIAMARRREGAR